MIEDIKFENLCELLEEARVDERVWEYLFAYVKDFGMDALSYHHHSPQGAYDFDTQIFFAQGFSSQSVKEYLSDEVFLNSPFENLGVLPNRPMSWADAMTNLGACEKFWACLMTLYCDGRQNNDCNGFILPVHGPNSRNGCVWLRLTDDENSLTKTDIRQLQWACQMAHKAFCRILDEKPKATRPLTVREQEILKWVARGKSNTVIADIIGISKHTVNGYLRQIYLKTNTSDRTMAAVRGIAEALI